MKDDILMDCWEATKASWKLAEELGYPVEIAYIFDISGILGTYFAQIDTIYEKIKRFADIRRGISEAQEGLLSLALNKRDSETVKKQFDLLFYRTQNKSKVGIYSQVPQIS